MANMETPRSPSVQSFASADTVSIAFTSTPGSPAMSPVSDDAAARAMHEATDVAAQSRRFYLDVRSLKLKLDDGTFYHVHRHFFVRHAPRFAEQYLCGETPDIIEVHDVSSVDFQRFLSIIYPSDLGVCDIHTVDEWTSVLRIATKWSVTSLRDVAVREIGANRPSPIDAILIAREFGLGEAWLVPAFLALCKSSQPLRFEDAEPLGFRTALEIGRVRELYLRFGESYDVEAAVRGSDVLLSPGADDADSLSATQLTPAPPTTILASALSPTPTVPSTPHAIHESGPASPLDQGRPGRLDGDDDLVHLAMLAEERVQAQLLNYGSDHHRINKNLFALRIAKRLVTETSSAAIRHRDWRQMWLGLGGYVRQRDTTRNLALDVHNDKATVFSKLYCATASHIATQLYVALDDPLFSGQTRSDVMSVTIQYPSISRYEVAPPYSVADYAEDIKKLLHREGFSWSEEADDVACILKVTIPSPGRDWFVGSR